ncbi:MAG: TonB-dependent receptor [Pseudomonadota bacterium]
MMFKPQQLAVAVASIYCSTLTVSAQAQGPALEEVFVTAQKRTESLQDVPISIVAISGDTLEQAGFNNLQELSFIMPNVTILQEQITDRINIRGIASGGNQGFDQSVGLFSSGVYLARGTQFRSAFLDVGMLEVLRGPQSTLFGKNTIAGAVNITPRRPDYEFGGELRADYETEFESWSTSGFLTGGLTDTLAARFAFNIRDEKGYIDNELLNTTEPDGDSDNYRVSLLWEPNDNLAVNLSYEAYSIDQDGKGWELLVYEQLDPATGAVIDPDFCPEAGIPGCGQDLVTYGTNVATVGDTTNFEEEEQSKLDTDLTALNIEYQWGDYTINSVTGYSNSELFEINPSAGIPFATTNTNQDEDFESWSQELRIASGLDQTIEWLAGVYYEYNEYKLKEQININDYFVLGPFALGAPGPLLGFNPRINQDFDQESETWAVFGQATWNITDSFRSTLGLRYSDEEKKATQSYLTDLPAPFDVAFGAENHMIPEQTYEKDNWSPSVNFQWDVNDEVMLYATWSIGYKSGGFDARISFDGTIDGVNDQAALEENFQYEQEKATTYEVGLKSAFAGGAAEFNAAVFYTEYEDLQFSIFNGGLAFLVDNAAGVDLQGFEFDVRWQLTDGLRLSGGGGYLDFEFSDFEDGACDIYAQTAAGGGLAGCTVDRSGETAMNAPEYTANLTLEWVGDITSNVELQLGATVMYEDNFFVAPDLDPLLEQGSFTKLNLRLGVGSIDGPWSFAFRANNVTDEDTFHYGTDIPLFEGARFVLADMPRTYTIEGVYRF